MKTKHSHPDVHIRQAVYNCGCVAAGDHIDSSCPVHGDSIKHHTLSEGEWQEIAAESARRWASRQPKDWLQEIEMTARAWLPGEDPAPIYRCLMMLVGRVKKMHVELEHLRREHVLLSDVNERLLETEGQLETLRQHLAQNATLEEAEQD